MEQIQFEKKNICGQMCLYTPNLYESDHCVVIFTGNPSIIGFYQDFAELLLKKYPNSSTVIPSILTTPMSDIAPNWFIDLKTACQIKTNFLDHLLNQLPSTTTFTVLTHSLGAYFSLHSIPNRPQFEKRIRQIIHIYPVLRDLKTSLSYTYKIFGEMYPIHPFVAPVVSLAKKLPFSLFSLIMKFDNSIPDDKCRILQEELNPHHVTQIAYFSNDEKKLVNEHDQRTIDCLKRTAKMTTVIFSVNDRYTPEWIRKEFVERYGDIKVLETEIKHAFVCGFSQQMFDFLEEHAVLK